MKKAQPINPECGTRLKSAIKYAKITQNTLAEDTFVSQQTISKIVNGKAPLTLENAHLFAKRLGVRWQYLACQDGFMTDTERRKQIISLNVDIKEECFALISALGYEIIDMEEKSDGSRESMHRPYKDIRINVDASEDEILSIARVTTPVRVYRIKSPDGRIGEIEWDDFIKLWHDIEDYTRFKCETHFERYRFERYANRKDRGF